MAKKVEKLSTCANCSTALQGQNFCPNCGQQNKKPDLHFGHFISESLSNFFAFDNKFFTTLITLFKAPGKAPREFIKGKRVAYMNPIRIYLMSTFILVFVLSLDLGERKKRIVEIKDSPTQKSSENFVTREDKIAHWQEINLNSTDTNERMHAYSAAFPKVKPAQALNDLGLKNTWKNRVIYYLSAKLNNFDADRFQEYYLSNLIWVLFSFVPLLALWLKLLYIRKRIHYLEHLFFGFYTQAAFFIVATLFLMLQPFLGETTLIIAALAFLVYVFISVKRFYGQSTRKTILKFVLMNVGYVLILLAVVFSSVFISYILF